MRAIILLALLMGPSAQASEILHRPYEEARPQLIAEGFLPVAHRTGCRETEKLGDWRCREFPEMELCRLEAPFPCIADWIMPSGSRMKIVVEGYDLIVSRTFTARSP
jgi:hypothetical protein